MIETAAVDEPAIVRLSKAFASRLEEEASEWPESAMPLARQLVPTAYIAAEELERAHWSERRDVLRDALSHGLEAMASIEPLLERAMAKHFLGVEKHSQLDSRLTQLQRLLKYLATEIEHPQ